MEEQKNVSKSRLLVAALSVVCIIAVVSWLSQKQSAMNYRVCSGVVWTTQYNVTYQSDKLLDDSIQAVFTAVDNSLSMFNKNSLITRINKDEDVPADTMLRYIYNASVKVNRETDGAFDPTVTPLMKMWGFVQKRGNVPTQHQIDSVLSFIGIENTTLNNGYIVKNDSRTAFDFSAIAKGFACDEIGRMLSRNGVQNYLVEVGGEISLNGVNNAGNAWRISVDKPIESSGMPMHENALVVSMNCGGIATSGNYRNYNIVEGQKVVHTMNPKTGYPEETNLLSATIIAENCMLADAYATACMVMGVERSKQLLERSIEIAGFLIYSNETDTLAMWCNNKFEEYVNK